MKRIILLSFVIFCFAYVSGQKFEMVTNMNAQHGGSNPIILGEYNGKLYFDLTGNGLIGG